MRASFRSTEHSRRGVALVLFVVLVFVFLAIASVAIDVGMASLTQQQMQVAVDTAALEGLRLRDSDDYEFLSDQTRRPKVSQLVRKVFDDNLSPTGWDNQPDLLQLGAGPMMTVTGNVGSSTMNIPATPVWDDPILQTNDAPGSSNKNKRNGDMVSGLFRPGVPSVESADYTRTDFEPSVLPGERWKALAFLVRMRRTRGDSALDSEAGVSSRGPTLPFLFGFGSTMLRDPDSSAWDPLRDGLSVRATAIAVARPALRASPPARALDGTALINESSAGSNPILGLYPFMVSLEFWTSTVMPGTWPPQSYEFTVQPDGGLLYVPTSQVEGRFASLGTSVGQPVATTPPVAVPAAQISGFIALYSDITTASGGTTRRVVGYGFADASYSGNKVTLKAGISAQPSTSTGDVTVWVGSMGVSARLDSSSPNLTATEWDQVMAKNRFLAYGGSNNPSGSVTYDFNLLRPGTLLAPVLAR